VKRLSLPRALTIRSRLLLFLALGVVLTALAISIVTSVLGSRDARTRIVGQLESVATLKEQEISTWSSDLGLNLDIVLSEAEVPPDLQILAQGASTEAERGEAYGRLKERFLWATIRMALFEELFFMDKDGVVLISTNPSHEGQRLGLNDYFIQGLRGRFLQQPSYSLSLGEMTIVASTPARSQGETLGVLAGRTDLNGLNEIMIERAGLGETGETYLVGSNYRLLTYLRQPGYSIPETYIRTGGTDAAIGRLQDGSDTYRGYSGPTVIGVYRWIPDLQLALMAEQEEAEALGPTRVALVTIGGVAVLAAALAILAGVALSRRIVRPLAQLGSTAGRIADGELDLEADVVREDEIGTLAHSFNRMTSRLRESVRSLERRSDHLRASNESGRQISSILELDELLPYVARLLLTTFDYESVRILLLTDETRGQLHTCNQAECGEPAVVDLTQSADVAALASVARAGEPVLVARDDDGATSAALEEAGAEAAPGAPGDADRGGTGGFNRYAEIAVPIRVKEDLVGVLDISARSGHPLDDQDLFAAQTLADQLAIAIENSRLYERANELATGWEW
jgi:HAMP domain-containing protein